MATHGNTIHHNGDLYVDRECVEMFESNHSCALRQLEQQIAQRTEMARSQIKMSLVSIEKMQALLSSEGVPTEPIDLSKYQNLISK